jgi:hypothetical protein
MNSLTICDSRNCSRKAEVVPKIIMPIAVDQPFNPRYDIGIVLGLKLCRRCAMRMNAAIQIAMPNFVAFAQASAKGQAKRLGLPYREPDFARAKLVRIKLGGPEHRRVAPQLEQPPLTEKRN